MLRLGNHVFIHIADNVNRALGLLEKGNNYDLILVDLNLPGLDGFAFIRLLNQRFVTAPVIVVSASEESQKVRQTLDSGAMGYIPKSTDARTLLSAIQQVLSGHVYIPEM